MADDVDRAKDIEMQQRDMALKKVQQREQPKQLFNDTGKVICMDCEDLISIARLSAKPDAARCFACKEALENKHKHFRR